MCICLLRIADAIEGAGGDAPQQEVSNDGAGVSLAPVEEVLPTPTEGVPVQDEVSEAIPTPTDDTPKEEESLLEKVEDKIKEIVEEVKEFFEGDDKEKSNDELDAPAE